MEITNRFTESGDELCKRKACRTLSDVLESEEFLIGCGDLSIFLGINDPGKPIMEDLSECNHLLVTGKDGVGKTSFVSTLLLGLISKYTPEETGILMIGKREEFGNFNGLKHLVQPLICDPAGVQEALSGMARLLQERHETFSSLKARNFREYSLVRQTLINVGKGDNIKNLQRIIVVVDGLESVITEETETILRRMTTLYRHTGIHLILTAHSTRDMSALMKADLSRRVELTRSGERVLLERSKNAEEPVYTVQATAEEMARILNNNKIGELR